MFYTKPPMSPTLAPISISHISLIHLSQLCPEPAVSYFLRHVLSTPPVYSSIQRFRSPKFRYRRTYILRKAKISVLLESSLSVNNS